MVLARKCTLTPPQLSLLNRGLNFIPTEGCNKGIMERARFDIQRYHRTIKLAVYYEDSADTEIPPFTPKSDWEPPEGALPSEVGSLIQEDVKYLEETLQVTPLAPNLTREEIQALRNLRRNKNIIIKPADKGSAVVVMDREQYLWEGYRQLNEVKYYRKLKKPIYPETIPMVSKILNTLHDKGYINDKQITYLLGSADPRPRRFYMLPKIHKEPGKWSRPHEIPPGRPIVSDCGSETYHTAEFIDYYLNPLSTTHPSYLKDTYDFIEKIKHLDIPENSLLFTIDIDSLYTNIDITEGIRAVANIFQKYRDKGRPDKEILELLEINLTRNDFEFDGEFYLQIKGTAMGKKFAPAYANIFMAEWEASALGTCSKKPLYYFRFLDDIWGVWTHSRGEFQVFLDTLNTHNPSIRIKSTTSQSSVDFLDTTTYKGEHYKETHRLEIKVYFKDTDTHALLHKTSFHPKHTYAGIVKSQLLRFSRICSRQEDFMRATKLLFSALSSRGYSRSFLRRQLKTFKQRKPTSLSSMVPFVSTYSPSTVKLVRAIKRNFHQFLESSEHLQDHRIIAAFRKNKNLQDILVRAKVPPLSDARAKPQHQIFQQPEWLQNKQNKRIFKPLCQGSLQSKNCVYVIQCSKCQAQYVGETGNTLATRFIQHRYNITKHKDTDTYLVQHFILHGWESLTVSVVESNPRWSKAQRRRAERLWISRLGSIHPVGLNEK